MNSQEIAKSDRVSIPQKVCYGLGGLGDFFIQNIVQALAIPIFAVGMKLDPLKLGIVLAATKVVSALADPFVGIVSDKTRTRWGRRKPFILLFGLLCAIMLPFVWLVPDISENGKFIYIFIVLSIYFFFHSLFSVPYNALGYEMTSDYDEKTKIFAWKNWIGIAGILAAAWFYRFTLMDVFESEMQGAMVLGVVAGLIIAFCTMCVSRGTREMSERVELHKEDKIPVFQALKTTFSNKPFLMIQGAILVIALGMGVDATIGMYLHVHYTCMGDKVLAADIGGVGGSIAVIPIFLALPTAVWIATKWGKREAAIFGVSVMLIGVSSIPWMMNQTYPYLIIVVWILSQFGSQCSGVIYGSMVADVCDEDELRTGERREGSYAAAGSFLNKAVQIIVLLLSGAMPRLAGYIDTSVDPTMEQLESMKFLLVLTDVIGVGLALFFLFFYPLSRKRCEEIKEQLELRKAQEESTNL